ncbi:hypothetical protein FSP39_015659 [Pinctada imbricata]|uniref:Metalloendopeptidase n=1 Tax=Pinctada imbricata TaxID=66713 RepID=A0AA88XT33_PINIB|nr:hypothetical protein FSP39_015659 [Pinctada imbricata]
MGFSHEQQRSDRDKYIIFDETKLKSDYDNADGDFKKEATDNSVPYDVQSIMQYRLTDFGKDEQYPLSLIDPNLAFLIESSSLTFYDVADVLTAYKCSAHCDMSDVPTCKYGILNHKCECYCMEGFKGSRCDIIETDSDCGGYIVFHEDNMEKYITSPNFPNSYPKGKLCRWVIEAKKGLSSRVIIEDLHLTYNALDRCYHWLEIQYNLPGQTGIKECGEITKKTFVSSDDSEGTMILTFNSEFVKNRPTEKGFILRVDAVGAGCKSSPCVYGRCVEGDTNCNFKCICDEGFMGKTCDTMKDTDKRLCLKFSYYMFGRTVDSLNVYISGEMKNLDMIWNDSGNLGDEWQEAIIDIPPTKQLKIVIEAIRGNSWDSDIAIDEIALTSGKCGDAKPRECLQTSTGSDYKGTLNITKNGDICQAWISQTPHKHDEYTDLEGNFCRNPDPGDSQAPWCYTMNKNITWDYCIIPHCESENCRRSDIGYEYDGVIHTTVSGKECQRWDSVTPHNHTYSHLSAHENFCRNTFGSKMRPWCYTTDKDLEWDFCDIPKCGSKPRECALTAIGYDYFGSKTQTSDGLACQGWDSMKPNFHEFGDMKEQTNFCRNPNWNEEPWCFTKNASVEWGSCDIPLCDEEMCASLPCQNGGTCIPNGDSYTCQCYKSYTGRDCEESENTLECLMTRNGREYQGTMNFTRTGQLCRNWKDTQYADSYGDQGNYCRYFNTNEIMCETNKGDLDICDVPHCQTTPLECSDTLKGERYFGTINIDENGYMCRRWDTDKEYMDHQTEENYCRNPGGHGERPWCLRENSEDEWGYCDIPAC